MLVPFYQATLRHQISEERASEVLNKTYARLEKRISSEYTKLKKKSFLFCIPESPGP
jgi:hypothetical protein